MKGFFDKIGKDVQKAINKNNNNNNRGGGQALGGSKPGKLLTDIYIVDQGPIGIKLENTSQNHAIVASVSEGSTAESIGLQRGDIICHPDCNGMKEMLYHEFLAMAKSSERPIRIDVRRMNTNRASAAAAAAASRNTNSKNRNVRADVESRRLAVIAAAEERNSKHKAKTRPIPKKKGGKVIEELTAEQLQKLELQKEENIKRNAEQMADKPLSDVAKKAVQAAKNDEVKHASELGYNPYEVRKVTASQASTASVAMTHGSINAGGAGAGSGSSNVGSTAASSASTSIPSVRPPANAMIPSEPEDNPIDSVFDEAFKELLYSNDNNNEKISKSLRILRKLIVNATNASSPDDPKRNIRMSEPNKLIKTCVIETNGAVELLMSVGFIMSEIDGKTFLVFGDDSAAETGSVTSWLSDALVKMEKYESYISKDKNETI